MLQAFVDKTHASAEAFSQRADVLAAVREARNPKRMGRVMRAFTFGKVCSHPVAFLLEPTFC